ncbi:MAG: GAF domain-containing protein [Desulfobacteraceae bacterium]|nr:MAG: GAF domain-containing protein [Desulfobacteraceae bacterium]
MKMLYPWLNRRLLKNRSLYGKLNLLFFFFFFIPVGGLIYFGIRYNLLTDTYLPFFFAALLAFSFVGLNLLRRVFDDISGFSADLSKKVQSSFPENQGTACEGDELHQLVHSFGIIDRHLMHFRQQLEEKIRALSVLKGVADLCFVTADPDEILYVALERSLAMTESDMGSVMLLEQPEHKRFSVRAAIGLDQWIKPGAYIDFETSIAKYAVLTKAALLVDDIEKDTRFGRESRPQYGTKSFICLPIKTSREIIGVLTISRRKNDRSYSADVIEGLEILLSNAAFTYENLMLAAENKQKQVYLKVIADILDSIHSGLRGIELLRACLSLVRTIIPFEAALIFRRDSASTKDLVVDAILSVQSTLLVQGEHAVFSEGGILDQVMRQQGPILLTDTHTLAEDHQMDIMGDQEQFPVYLATLKTTAGVSAVLALVVQETLVWGGNRTFIEWACRCLALAIERNTLYEAVAKRNQELDSIRRIGGALASSTFDIGQVLNYTMDMIRTIMNVEAGVLYLVKDGELEFSASFNITPRLRKPVRLKLGQGISGHVAARGESMIVNEVKAASSFLPHLNADLNLNIRSALCVPMVSQGRVIGVIEVINKASGEFISGDQDLLQSIASSVSIAVENAHLYNETVHMAEKERGIRRIFQKFVPKEVLEKILRGPDAGIELAEEIKTLTLLNIDLRGFSGLVKRLGPQKTVYLLNAFFSLMGGIVFKHHGIVDKYLGDGFLAIFGAPISSMADADNALNAALEMQASLDTINSGPARELGVELKIGISVHTGEVVVGNIGFDMKMDYTVIGDPVNDVFRLQDIVSEFPNSIFFSTHTLRASRMALNYIELDEQLGEAAIYELLGRAR